MDIAVYAICYNEEYMLPFFLKHYQSFASSITIYDNHSNDKSVHIMNKAGVNVEYYKSDNEIRDDIMLNLKNQFWKKSRGLHDWVIVADIDEFIYHPNITRFLLKNHDKSLLVPNGFNMFAKTLPDPLMGQIYDQAICGTANPEFCNKPCIFRPNKIKEINFEPGGHRANPTGEVVWHGDPELKLLHCDYLTLEYRLDRCQNRGRRLSSINKQNCWGIQYMRSHGEIIADYHQMWDRSERVIWTTPSFPVML